MSDNEVDGFGVPFNQLQQHQHRTYLTLGRGDESFKPTTPDLPVYEGEHTKDRPAGWWDKMLEDGTERKGL